MDGSLPCRGCDYYLSFRNAVFELSKYIGGIGCIGLSFAVLAAAAVSETIDQTYIICRVPSVWGSVDIHFTCEGFRHPVRQALHFQWQPGPGKGVQLHGGIAQVQMKCK